jgi:hypothetical protein
MGNKKLKLMKIKLWGSMGELNTLPYVFSQAFRFFTDFNI